jgi:hypothetical protein
VTLFGETLPVRRGGYDQQLRSDRAFRNIRMPRSGMAQYGQPLLRAKTQNAELAAYAR